MKSIILLSGIALSFLSNNAMNQTQFGQYENKLIKTASQGLVIAMKTLLANPQLKGSKEGVNEALKVAASYNHDGVISALMENTIVCDLLTSRGIYCALVELICRQHHEVSEPRNLMVKKILSTKAIHKKARIYTNDILEKIASRGTPGMLHFFLSIGCLRKAIDEAGACTALVSLTLFSPEYDRGEVLKVLLDNSEICKLLGYDNETAMLIFENLVKYPRKKTIAVLFGSSHMRKALGESKTREFANRIIEATQCSELKALSELKDLLEPYTYNSHNIDANDKGTWNFW